MESVTVILLVVVILAQIVLFALFFIERQRNNRRNKSILNYIDNTITEEVDRRIKEQEEKNAETLNSLKLDYSQAQQAANRINDFGGCLANIFDYDPLKAIQKGRRTEAG